MRVLLPCARALEDLLWGICFNYKIGCGWKALFKQSPFQIRRSAWRHQRGRVRAISGTACRSDVDSCLGRLGCRLEGNSHIGLEHTTFFGQRLREDIFFSHRQLSLKQQAEHGQYKIGDKSNKQSLSKRFVLGFKN